MKKHWYLIYLLFGLYLLLSIPINADADEMNNELPEIHLVVDVSASLKRTDPQNLRINAIKMFNYLSNQKVKMSLSVFAKDYKEIIPLQLVTPHYEQLFLDKIKDINANGSWTNIDGALNEADKSWGKGKRIIILLTDGQLDLGSDQLNTQSRAQLNNITIPKLQQDNVQVYTIGLSDQSDQPLLSNLSLKTNGISQTVISANDLDNVLYSLFTAIANAEGTSLNKNEDSTHSIKVDPSIHALTLIFKKGLDLKDLNLISPDGVKHSLAKEDDGFLATKNYDVVQIKKPLPGEWRLPDPEHKMERVLILTDIHLASDFNTGLYFNNEYLTLTGYLQQDNKPIINDMAVDGMTMNLELKNKNNKFSYVIPYDKNGLFDNDLILNIPAGNYKATWSAQSSYLSRELQFMIVIEDTPFIQRINLEHDSLLVQLMKPEIIKDSTVAVKFFYNNEPQDIKVNKTALSWIADLYTLCEKPGFTEDNVLIQITAQTFSGRDLLFKQLLNGKVCSPNYVPLPIAQPIDSHAKPLPKPAEKITNNNINSKKYYLFLILLVIAVLIAIVLLAIRYRNKMNKVKEESNEQGQQK